MSAWALSENHPFSRDEKFEKDVRTAWLALRLVCVPFDIDPRDVVKRRQKGDLANIRALFFHAVKGKIPNVTLAEIIGYNRTTIEDDQNAMDRWRGINSMVESASDYFAALLEPVQAIAASAGDLLEELRLERAADKPRDKAPEKAKNARLAAQVARLESIIRTTRPDWEAYMVAHWGAKQTAEKISPKARAGLILLFVAERQEDPAKRIVTEAMIGATCAEELIRFGLAKRSTLNDAETLLITQSGANVVKGARLRTANVKLPERQPEEKPHPFVAALAKSRDLARRLGPISHGQAPAPGVKCWAHVEDSIAGQVIRIGWAGPRDTIEDAKSAIQEALRVATSKRISLPEVLQHPTMNGKYQALVRVGEVVVKPTGSGRAGKKPAATR